MAWHLLQKAGATEEEIDAVSLLALSLEKRFKNIMDTSSVRLPVATPTENHVALWLGGGVVVKTRTLREVVEPLAVTFFGENGARDFLRHLQAREGAPAAPHGP